MEEADTGAMQPRAKQDRGPQRLKEAREDPPLGAAEEPCPAHTLISDFWPLELGGNKVLLFYAM